MSSPISLSTARCISATRPASGSPANCRAVRSPSSSRSASQRGSAFCARASVSIPGSSAATARSTAAP